MRTLLFGIVVTVMLASPSFAQVVRVIDGDTIEIGQTTYRLHGIDAPEYGQRCETLGSATWPCGKGAVAALEELVLGREVFCNDRGADDYGRIISVCEADGRDVNAAMVETGFAWAFTRFSDDYVREETLARSAGVGIWQAPTMTAWNYRALRWQVAQQEAPKGCPIKGNISSNGRIYHTPWSPRYSRTKLSVERGERWFCSEAEALQAGWRAPRWGRRWIGDLTASQSDQSAMERVGGGTSPGREMNTRPMEVGSGPSSASPASRPSSFSFGAGQRCYSYKAIKPYSSKTDATLAGDVFGIVQPT